jgi:hypothetical protein
MEYTVFATSASTGASIRELQLESPQINNPRLAQLHAQSFALRLNQAANSGLTDWVGHVGSIDPEFHVRTN